MIPIRRTAVATLALSAVLGLSACNNDTQVDGAPSETGSSQGSTGSPSTPAASPSPDTGSDRSTTSDAGESGTEDDTSAATSPSSRSTPEAPATTGRLKDKHAIPVERTELPKGPVTSVGVQLLGGYATSEEYGEFYAVLDVDSVKRGLVTLQYVMLDKNGNALKTVNDSIAVGGERNEMKVIRAAGKLPDFGKVERVRLKVVSNKENSFATVTQIKPHSITIDEDASTNTPTVSGQYRTVGKASVVSMNAVCVDKHGQVRTDSSPVDKIKAPDWTPFTVKMLSVDSDYQPVSCFVGS